MKDSKFNPSRHLQKSRPTVVYLSTALLAMAVSFSPSHAAEDNLAGENTNKSADSSAGANTSAGKQTPTDEMINAAVENYMLYDSSVPTNYIDIRTADGIVTLSGTVPNILGKDRAAKVAEGIKGVRAVVNSIRVNPVKRSDDEVLADVKLALKDDPTADVYELEPIVKDGVVTLSGDVDSWRGKQLSASVARSVKGVKEVKNQIEIAYKSERPDNEITAEINQVLKRDVWVEEAMIEVASNAGKVTLTGTVGSVAVKNRAFANAWTAGVKFVDAEGLQVQPWAMAGTMKKQKTPSPTDEQIASSVTAALAADPRISPPPTVSVEDGRVTLSGTLGNLKAKRAAQLDANNTVGVLRVTNLIKVRGGEIPDKEMVAKNVGRALSRDPLVDRYNITLSVNDGVLSLDGFVDTSFEKSHAENIATGIRGVSSIRNNLVVGSPSYGYYTWQDSDDSTLPFSPSRPAISPAWPQGDDAALKENIRSEFYWSPFVASDDIDISVNDGVVTLTGSAGSWREVNSATTNAYEGGARNVTNNLKVK